MGTKDYLERTLPVRPSERTELQNELDWFVFTVEKYQKPNSNDK